jgi:hypothetical protein
MRLRTGISILHGDNMELATRIRRHANFTESVPFALILLGFLELNGASTGLLHGLGIALVASRIVHPLGLQHDNVRNPLRGIGAGVTHARDARRGGDADLGVRVPLTPHRRAQPRRGSFRYQRNGSDRARALPGCAWARPSTSAGCTGS